MVQLFLLLAIGIIGWMGYQKFIKEAERVRNSVRQAKKEAENEASGTLVQDPTTGEYRVDRRDEES